MAVGDDDAADRPAESVGDLLPGLLGSLDTIAGVDDRHAVAVLDQPQVDVVQGEGAGACGSSGRRVPRERSPAWG